MGVRQILFFRVLIKKTRTFLLGTRFNLQASSRSGVIVFNSCLSNKSSLPLAFLRIAYEFTIEAYLEMEMERGKATILERRSFREYSLFRHRLFSLYR